MPLWPATWRANLPWQGVQSTIDAVQTVTDNLPDAGSLTSILNQTGQITDMRDEVKQFGNGYVATKQVTFSAATSDDLFEVTGLVEMSIVGYLTTVTADSVDVLSVGVAGSLEGFMVDTQSDALRTAGIGTIWTSATLSNLIASTPDKRLVGAESSVGTIDVICTSTANVDEGVIVFYAFWRPLSSGASVVAL